MSFLESVTEKIGATSSMNRQSNTQFMINPSKLHLVAGNPMRYKGAQQVKYDSRWEKDLTAKEITIINRALKK